MPEPTPGQIAYEAYVAELRPSVARYLAALFAHLDQDEHRAWEAAAQAVLDAQEPRSGIILSRAELAHLLHCLANQKSLHAIPEPLREGAQAIIDMAWRKGMDWLTHAQEETPRHE